MLISEGLCYAGITLVLVLSIGNLIAYGIFKFVPATSEFCGLYLSSDSSGSHRFSDIGCLPDYIGENVLCA